MIKFKVVFLENAKDVRFSTIMRVFDALKAKVKMSIEFNPDTNFEIAFDK